MKSLKIIIFCISICLSCKSKDSKLPVHKDVLGFKTLVLADLGDDKFDNIEMKAEKEFLEIKYINDIIYVSHFEILNACGNYEGDIVKSNDTIRLKLILTSEEVCTSLDARRVTYFINNPNQEKFTILKN